MVEFLDGLRGKNTVFLLSRKINSDFFQKLNVSDDSESYLIVLWIIIFFQIFFGDLNFCHPKPRPTTLQSYLTYHV